MQRFLHNSSAHTLTSSDGTKINYEITPGSPSKPTLLFLHGMGGNLTAWDKERQYFQDLGFPTIAIDLRGHGLSGRPRNAHAYDISQYARDIMHVMEVHNGTFIVLGHCFGGMVALTLAGKLQTPMKGLVLIDTSYKAPRFSEQVANHLVSKIIMASLTNIPFTIGHAGYTNYHSFIHTGDFNPQRIFWDIWHTSLQSYLYTSKSLLSFNGDMLLPQIQVATLIIEGTNDAIFPPHVAEQLSGRIRHSHLEFIPKANHILVLNNPEELSSTIAAFIEKL